MSFLSALIRLLDLRLTGFWQNEARERGRNKNRMKRGRKGGWIAIALRWCSVTGYIPSIPHGHGHISTESSSRFPVTMSVRTHRLLYPTNIVLPDPSIYTIMSSICYSDMYPTYPNSKYIPWLSYLSNVGVWHVLWLSIITVYESK